MNYLPTHEETVLAERVARYGIGDLNPGELAAYTAIRSRTVTVWHVGSNEAGYLPNDPESVTHTLNYPDAVAAYADMLSSAADDYLPGFECACTDTELCEYCSTDACARGMVKDDVPFVSRSTAGRNLSHWINIDSRRIEFWLTSETMTYGAFIDGYAA